MILKLTGPEWHDVWQWFVNNYCSDAAYDLQRLLGAGFEDNPQYLNVNPLEMGSSDDVVQLIRAINYVGASPLVDWPYAVALTAREK